MKKRRRRSIQSLLSIYFVIFAFLLLPDRLLRRLALLTPPGPPPDSAARARAYTVRRLNAAAAAFRDLSDQMQEAVKAMAPAHASARTVFDRAADRVCAKCALRELCWSRDYQATRSALNDALPLLLDKGRGTAAEYPPWFTAKCVEFKAFSAAVNVNGNVVFDAVDVNIVNTEHKSHVKGKRCFGFGSYL